MDYMGFFMNLEHAPWLFTLALFYVFVIVALLSVEIVKKTLIPHKWKTRTALLGIMPLLLALIIAVFSMAGELLYLLPEYTSGQQMFMQFVDTAYGYNNNLLIMIPMGLFYFIVLSISGHKKFLLGGNQSGHNKCQINAAGDSIHASNSNSVLQQREMDLKQESEEDKRKDEEWRDACAVDDNYWNNWSNP
jgi:hypothetical protein